MTQKKEICIFPEAIRAGWGHIVSVYALWEGLLSLKRESMISNPLTPDSQASKRFDLLALLHTASQEKDSYGKIDDNTKRSINESLETLPFLPRRLFIILKPLLEHFMISNKEKGRLEKILEKYPILAIAIYNLVAYLNFCLIGKSIAQYLAEKENKESIDKISLPLTTHGITAGLRKGVLNVILDPGFSFSGLLFSPQNLLAMLPPPGPAINLVPTCFERDVLEKYFGRESFSLGTIGQLMDPNEVKQKWENVGSIEKPVIILASTSGNAANLDELLTIKNDFLKRERGERNYKLIFFLGEHPDTKNSNIPSICQEGEIYMIKTKQDLEGIAQKIQETNDRPLIIRTENQFLTAQAKLLLERLAHIEVVKPGEASFMNPHTATVNYFLKPAGPNEPMNGIWSVLVYKSGFFFPNTQWEDHIKALLSKEIHFLLAELTGEELLSFASSYIYNIINWMNKLKEKNFFEQVDSLFQEQNIIKIAIESYCNARNIIYIIKQLIDKIDGTRPINLILRELQEEADQIFEEIRKKRREILQPFLIN